MPSRRDNSTGSQEERINRAKALAEKLSAGIDSNERQYHSERLDIFIADVESDVDRFNWWFRFYDRYGVPFPCLKVPVGDPIPIDIGFGYPFPQELDFRPYKHYFYDWYDDYVHSLQKFFGQAEIYPFDFSPREVLGFLMSRLVNFLTSRLSKPHAAKFNFPGVSFQVFTKTHGLRVHYSPAYFFNPSLVFGSPTSPVKGLIQPGRYIFGVAGPDLIAPRFMTLDEYDIPPLKRADLDL